MDAADQAQALNELFHQKALNAPRPAPVPFSGNCLVCEDPVHEARFCGVVCRDQFDREMKAKFRSGTHKQRR